MRMEPRAGRAWTQLLAFAVAAGVMLTSQLAGAAETINVTIDRASLVKLPERVATIVVGNPLIADVSLQTGGMLVVTGKGYGSTNLIALDRAGTVLMERSVQVRGPQENVVVVYRGVERETLSCAPRCERRITLGDAPPYFDAAVGQTGTRNTLAVGGALQQPGR